MLRVRCGVQLTGLMVNLENYDVASYMTVLNSKTDRFEPGRKAVNVPSRSVSESSNLHLLP